MGPAHAWKGRELTEAWLSGAQKIQKAAGGLNGGAFPRLGTAGG